MSICFGADLTSESVLASCAEQHLPDISVTAGEIESIRAKLGAAVS